MMATPALPKIHRKEVPDREQRARDDVGPPSGT